MFFDVEREVDGSAKIVLPGTAPPTEEKLFRRRLFLLGITDAELVEKRWQEYRAEKEREHKARGSPKYR